MLDNYPNARLFLRNFISPNSFVMYHIGRSGSSVLTDMLRQHKELKCDGEIFHGYFGEIGQQEANERGQRTDTPWLISPFFPNHPDKYLLSRLVYASLKTRYGFEIKFSHLSLSGVSQQDFFKILQSLNFTKTIILKRNNYLRKIVSSLVGKARKKLHSKPDERITTTAIEINPNLIKIDSVAKPLMDFLIDYDKEFDLLDSLIDKDNTLQLIYEEDIQTDPRIAYRKVCHFLGIQPKQDINITLKRTTPEPLSEIVTNFREIENHLKGTKYEWMTMGE